MSKFEHKKVMPRYSAIAIIMTLIATAIVGKALYIMTAKHDYWMQVAERQKKDSVTVKPNRGNILSCAGQLMASSLPEFKVFMDFKALTEAGNDSLWDAKQDSICQGLHKIFPEKTAEEFKRHLIEGRGKKSRHSRAHPLLPVFQHFHHAIYPSTQTAPYGRMLMRYALPGPMAFSI